MTSQTFYFFDYETFGTSPAYDRPCQFAGIRTDADFNIIGEPLVIYCQPPVDYLPQPEACLITGITPQLAMEKGLPEPEFIRQIHQELSKPNTCSLGYNNIRFDDEVSRYTLYRNFFDPYGWSWQNNNSRWDLLDVMRTAYALRPEGIQWPTNDEGLTSFKLEHLSAANGISHENAHDALADVIATIEIAKKLKQAQPQLFNYLLTHRHKNKVKNLVDMINMTPLVHVSGMFGVQRSNISLISPVAWHPSNDNAFIAVDLSKDIQPLIDLDADSLRARLYTKHADLLPDELPVPVKLIHINKCPVLATEKVLKPQDAIRIGLDRDYCFTNAERLKAHPEIREKLIAVFQNKEEYKNTDVDAALYDNFFSHADKSKMDVIRSLSPDQFASFELNVADKRIKPLFFRYRARHYPFTLNENEQAQWALHCRDYFDHHMQAYLERLRFLFEEHKNDEKKMFILKALVQYSETKQ